MTGTLNPQEVNYRIQAAYIDDIISGTKCKPSQDSGHYHGTSHQNPSSLQNHNYHYSYNHHY